MSTTIREPPAKKARTISNSTANSILNHIQTDSNEYVPVFYSEVSDIMRSFGDSDNPIRESVILVEKILYQQLRGILQEAVDCAVERKGQPEPTQLDFEYLMRKNTVKQYRLQKFVKDLQMKLEYQKVKQGRNLLLEDITGNDHSDESGDEARPVHDEEKTRRIFRADRMSELLDAKQYESFIKSRQVSFCHENSYVMKTKFRSWLNIPVDVKLSNKVMTILSYLAHETIATLMDFCILTRLNSTNRPTEPFTRVTSTGTSYNMLHLCPEVTQGRGGDGTRPITFQEIQEAMRRHSFCATRNLGTYRNLGMNQKVPYLALH